MVKKSKKVKTKEAKKTNRRQKKTSRPKKEAVKFIDTTAEGGGIVFVGGIPPQFRKPDSSND